MATIPASQIVQVIPGVLSAGGNALVLQGLFLTQNTRVPLGQVLSFPSAASVSTYFGPSSIEAAYAAIYFGGYTGCTQLPGSLLFTQYNSAAAPAYLRSGPVNTLTVAQIQALSGSLTILIDGYTHTAGSLNLSSATSYSSAAALIQTALNASEPTEASVTGAIAASTSAFTGSIGGYILNVTVVASGTLVPGTVVSGTGVTAGTQITSQLSGVTGGVGTYAVSAAQIVASGSLTGAYGTLTVSAVASGSLSVGQTLTGTGVTAGTLIAGLGTGTGLTGTYYVTPSQTVTSETITATATNCAVTYDSVSGGFVITSGIAGPSSGIAYATGTLSAPLLMTQATGAVLSLGGAASTPSAFMNNILNITDNWASFLTVFDPDGGSGNVQKLAFAAWNNSIPYDDYVYLPQDSDPTPTLSAAATTSLGNLIKTAGYNGTTVVWEPSEQYITAFIAGTIASINFGTVNGRITFAFKGQSGLTAGVTNATVAANLIANGYTFYGAYATANQTFVFLYPGSVSGGFQWLDSYVNQIWLNNGFQQALVLLLTQVTSIPYTTPGYQLIAASLQSMINQGLSFGAFRAGVPLSSAQVAEVNYAAGVAIDQTLTAQGWYLQILPPTAQVREARGTPVMKFWYMDGQAVQQITLASVDVQ